MAEIADSFEAVWHERTSLSEEVRQLQEQLRREETAIAKLRAEAERSKADRDALLAELEHAQADVRELLAAMEQLEPARGDRGEEESSAERAQLRDAAEELRKERDRLLEEVRRVGALTAKERETRQKLVDFLLDALKQVERAPSNGSEAAAKLSELRGLQNGLRNVGHRSSGSASEDEDTATPSQ